MKIIHPSSYCGRKHLADVALRRSWGLSEVDLVVGVVARVGDLGRGLVEWATSLVEVGGEEGRRVWAQGAGWAAECGVGEERCQLGGGPGDTLLSEGRIAGKSERGDGVESLHNVTEDGVGVEVRGAELTDRLADDVGWDDGGDDVAEDVDGAVFGGAAVPVLWPLLWNVLVFAAGLVVLETDNARDGLVVGNTSSAVGTVGEEVWVEGESSGGDDRWEWEVVDVWVVGLGELADGGVVLAHGWKTKVLVGGALGGRNELLDNTGRNMVVVTTSVVVVLTGRGDISLNGGVAVETTNAARTGAQVK